MKKDNRILVTGHKNPDTDSICSAIAYARLKNKISEDTHIPCRAGRVNEETQYVLNYYQVEVPELIEDVRTQIRDIEIRQTAGVKRDISLKKAWMLMKEEGVVTLPITRNGRLEGLITIADITKTYMDAYDSAILSSAHTRVKNIVETLDAALVVGDSKTYYTKGKVLVAAANPDLMESYIKPGDLVLLGNRYESQLCAIEMAAACIIVCEGAPVSLTIRRLAEERGCTVISTPYDTFTASRLINQSMPVSYFMKRDHLITFNTDDFIDDIRDTMARVRHRDFPILDGEGRYIGMISRRNLLGARKKQVIMVDHNERTQAVNGIESAEILEIIDHHRLGTIETMAPVFFRNQPLGCTATIVYQMYEEVGVEIDEQTAGLLCSAIISDTLLFRSPTCTVVDKMTAQKLAAIAKIDMEAFAKDMFAAGSNLAGKTEEQIFYQDFKEFSMEGRAIGVGQISSMNSEELDTIEKRLEGYLEKVQLGRGLDMVFFMLTNILEESTRLLYCGDGAAKLVESSFEVTVGKAPANLPGVVSRKKQLIPALINGLESDSGGR